MSAQVLHDGRVAGAPSLEIETLRTLVQNLETQNAALRAKGLAAGGATPVAATAAPHATVSADGSKLASTTLSDMVAGEQQQPRSAAGFGGAVSPLDTVPLLDVEGDTSLDEESSWLYVSPSKYAATCTSSSPEKWMRQDFDEPTANSRLARRSLYFTLDDVINECSSPKTTAAAASVASHKETSGHASGGAYSSFTGASAMGPVPTATAGSNDADRSPPNTMAADRLGPAPAERSPPGTAAGSRHGLEPTAAVRQQPSSSRSTEMLDIQAMARLQEQSLRESFNSLRRASGSSSGSIPQLNLNDLDSSTGSSMSGSARHPTPDAASMLRGSMDTYRVEKSAVVNGSVAAVQQPTALSKAAPAGPQSQSGGVGSRAASPPDLGSSSSSSSSTSGGSPSPASAAVRRSLPVPTRIGVAGTAVPPRSREPSPAAASQLPMTAAVTAAVTATTASARPALPQPSSLPRASNLPMPGSRRSGLPTPRSSAAAAFTRSVD